MNGPQGGQGARKLSAPGGEELQHEGAPRERGFGLASEVGEHDDSPPAREGDSSARGRRRHICRGRGDCGRFLVITNF